MASNTETRRTQEETEDTTGEYRKEGEAVWKADTDGVAIRGSVMATHHDFLSTKRLLER